MPQINLVPMLDVLMSVLTFFILISMTLTGQKLGDILLPGTESSIKPKEENPLVIGLQKDGKVLLEGNSQPTDKDIEQAMKAYQEKSPGGTVILKADRELPYQEVDKVLKRLMEMGGSNVSLAIEKD